MTSSPLAVPNSAATTASTVTLFLMTQKGYQILVYILENFGTSLIEQVIGAPDKALVKDYYQEIRQLCEKFGIRFYNRTDTNIRVTGAFSLAISWRWLIKSDSQLIVLHDSILPRYRGFAPLVNCLINGEEEIGVTGLYADEEFDRGDVIYTARHPVKYPLTIAQAIEFSLCCYKEVIKYILTIISANKIPSASPQDEQHATYSLWRDEADYRLDWSLDSHRLQRTVDALGWPYQGARTLLDGEIAFVIAAEVLEDVVIENRSPGKVLFMMEKGPVIVCRSGLLLLTDLRNQQGESLLPLKKFRVRFT